MRMTHGTKLCIWTISKLSLVAQISGYALIWAFTILCFFIFHIREIILNLHFYFWLTSLNMTVFSSVLSTFLYLSSFSKNFNWIIVQCFNAHLFTSIYCPPPTSLISLVLCKAPLSLFLSLSFLSHSHRHFVLLENMVYKTVKERVSGPER